MIVVPDIQFNMVIRSSCLILRDLNLMSENQAVFRLEFFARSGVIRSYSSFPKCQWDCFMWCSTVE